MTARRAVLRGLGAAALIAGPLRSGGQQPPKGARVGILWPALLNDPLRQKFSAVFRQRLGELGHVEGKTLFLEERFSDGSSQRLGELASELVQAKVAVILAPTVSAALAARQATDTIPIVMLFAGNPVGAGLIASLARPGGNVTGTSNLPLGGKHVDLMREIVPRIARLAVLVNPNNAGARNFVASMSDAARSVGIDVTVVEVARAENFAAAFASIRDARPDWLHVAGDPMLGSHRAEWVEFAMGAHLPVSSDAGETARVGGLISYGPLLTDHFLLGAAYVDKIIKGAKPADLPVEQPTRYELFLNLKTARLLGLTIPQSVLLRADEVIQ